MQKTFALVIMVLGMMIAPLLLQAQKYFIKGSYVDNRGKNFETFIATRNQSLRFMLVRDSENGQTDTLYAKNIKEVIIADQTKYISGQSPSELKIKLDSKWLRILGGEVSLLEQQINSKRYYYYQVEGSNKILLQTSELSSQGENSFRQQVWEKFKCDDITIQFLKETNYNRGDLKRTFQIINECNNSKYNLDIVDVTEQIEPTKTNPTIFYKSLIDGEISLLELDNYDKKYFFVKDTNDSLHLLLYNSRIQNGRKIEEKIFVNQLRGFLDCQVSSESVSYDRKSLMKVMQNCFEINNIPYRAFEGNMASSSYWNYFRITGKFGLSYNKVAIDVGNRPDVEYNGIGGAFGLEFQYTNPKLQAFSLVSQLDIKYFQKGEGFRYPSIELLFGGRLNLINLDKEVVAVSGGINLVTPVSTVVYQVAGQSLEGFYPTPYLAASYLKNRLLFEYRWEAPASVISTSNNIDYSVFKNTLQIGYIIK